MAKPIFFLLHREERVLEALDTDLRARFGAHYTVLAERSPSVALEKLTELAAGSEQVALLIAAPQIAEMAGVDFLVRAHGLHPRARRVMLIGRGEWGSDHPAARALTLGEIDSYLFDPWIPAERWLYLPVSEFLANWIESQAPLFEAIQIIGRQGNARSHELRDTFTRIGIPYGFYSADSEAGRRLLQDVGQDGTRLPVVVFHSGEVCLDPSDAELSEALGFRTHPAVGACDLVVIGAGPTGLAAAVYGASEGLRTMVVEPETPGGQAGTSSLIRNYLGFPRGLSGDDLANRAVEQAWLFGADFVLAQRATGLSVRGPDRLVQVSDGSEVAARAVIIATGVSWRRLGVASLETLRGAGVFYGAAGAEARALESKDVFVVGAGNSAGQAAVHLAKWAASVTMLIRGGSLEGSMSDYLVQQIRALPNVGVRLRTEVIDGHGVGRLEGLTLRDNAGGAHETVPATALFVMIGAAPHTDWLAAVVERDEAGYVLTGRDLVWSGAPPAGWPLRRQPLLLETSVAGVFAVGDVRHRSVKRVASAVGEGAIAVQLVHEYLGADTETPSFAAR